jgi:hypothetical protein
MRKYALKTLVYGYKISPIYKDTLFCPIPFEAGTEGVDVYCGDEKKTFHGEPVTKISFPDKYGRDKSYTLHYYRWDSGATEKQMEIKFE